METYYLYDVADLLDFLRTDDNQMWLIKNAMHKGIEMLSDS